MENLLVAFNFPYHHLGTNSEALKPTNCFCRIRLYIEYKHRMLSLDRIDNFFHYEAQKTKNLILPHGLSDMCSVSRSFLIFPKSLNLIGPTSGKTLVVTQELLHVCGQL